MPPCDGRGLRRALQAIAAEPKVVVDRGIRAGVSERPREQGVGLLVVVELIEKAGDEKGHIVSGIERKVMGPDLGECVAQIILGFVEGFREEFVEVIESSLKTSLSPYGLVEGGRARYSGSDRTGCLRCPGRH